MCSSHLIGSVCLNSKETLLAGMPWKLSCLHQLCSLSCPSWSSTHILSIALPRRQPSAPRCSRHDILLPSILETSSLHRQNVLEGIKIIRCTPYDSHNATLFLPLGYSTLARLLATLVNAMHARLSISQPLSLRGSLHVWVTRTTHVGHESVRWSFWIQAETALIPLCHRIRIFIHATLSHPSGCSK